MKSLFLLIAVVATFIYSCKKDKEIESIKPTPPNTPTTTYPNFSKLKVGNYWIYQQFNVDTSGNVTPKNIFDSCYVEKDTSINGRTYFKVFRPVIYTNYLFLRDSLQYIVDSAGQVLFSSTDFSNNLSLDYSIAPNGDTICQIIRKMTDLNLEVTVPAGTFTTLNAKETFNFYPNWVAYSPRHKQLRYAKEIGIVVETLPFYSANPNYIERRLVRYNIN